MPRFHPLTVTNIRKTIRDAVVVTFDTPTVEEFDFVQGQYLTFRRAFDGEELRRSYSICSGKHEGKLQVGIKRVEGGTFSTWANEELKVGDTLEAMPPMGRFFSELQKDGAKNYLGFAGGSGITPLLSIIKTTLVAEPQSSFTLIYANKAVSTIMFREEFEDLKNRYMGRLNVIHVLENGPQDVDLFSGMVTEEKCEMLFQSGWVDPARVDTAFICGPEPMMLGIAAALRKAGMEEEQIKFELFASNQPGRAKQKATSRTDAEAGQTVSVSIIVDAQAREIESDRDTSILDAALNNNIDAPYACKGGVCSTCRCKVVSGEVEMISNHALEDYEVRDGYILSCQSYPLTDKVVVDYDD